MTWPGPAGCLLNLPLSDGSGRRTMDGLIVRNPTSFLLKEWARRDVREPSLGSGISFLMTNFWDERFILGVDPEKGVNLRGLGSLLNDLEAAKEGGPGPAVSASLVRRQLSLLQLPDHRFTPGRNPSHAR